MTSPGRISLPPADSLEYLPGHEDELSGEWGDSLEYLPGHEDELSGEWGTVWSTCPDMRSNCQVNGEQSGVPART